MEQWEARREESSSSPSSLLPSFSSRPFDGTGPLRPTLKESTVQAARRRRTSTRLSRLRRSVRIVHSSSTFTSRPSSRSSMIPSSRTDAKSARYKAFRQAVWVSISSFPSHFHLPLLSPSQFSFFHSTDADRRFSLFHIYRILVDSTKECLSCRGCLRKVRLIPPASLSFQFGRSTRRRVACSLPPSTSPSR